MRDTPRVKEFLPLKKANCTDMSKLAIEHSIAFQPIVNILNKTVYGYEALVRGINNEGADFVLFRLNDSNRF